MTTSTPRPFFSLHCITIQLLEAGLEVQCMIVLMGLTCAGGNMNMESSLMYNFMIVALKVLMAQLVWQTDSCSSVKNLAGALW